MITKTTNLDSAYNSLFDEVRIKSNGQIDVDNIESYYGRLGDIKLLDSKFLRLPLDEPVFEIDANTRSINIPAEFRSNGLSVQGDHLAEMVFFKIDRYFDYTDLSSTNICINWKMGNRSGKTKNFIMSKEILPGYVIFGWPIDNIITEKGGQLTFAVEFSIEDNDKIKYNFNTLPATINIKDGLVLSKDVEMTDLNDDILSIITNSSFGSGEAAVGPVQWVTGNGLVLNISNDENIFIPSEFNSVINLNTTFNNEGEPISEPIDLFAEGYVDNATELHYMNTIGENIFVYKQIPAYEEGMTLPTNQRYYVKDSNDPEAYILARPDDLVAWEDEEDPAVLYIKLGKINASAAGVYSIKAQGEKYNNNNERIGAGDVAATEAIIIPTAQTPSSIEIISSNNENEEEDNYSFADDIQNVVFLNDENKGVLTAAADVEDFGALQFIWQQKLDSSSSFTNINEDNDYSLVNESTQEISAEGKYRVIVNNFKNGTYADQAISDEWTASLIASPIISASCKRDNHEVGSVEKFNSNGDALAQHSVTLTITDVDRGENPRGNIEYQWISYDRVVSTNATITITEEGDYTPVVKNIYNGSIYTKTLNTITVDDDPNYPHS